jgi:hypothetical protein
MAEDGKRTSRLNAYRHGLTGQIEVMTPEEKEIHDEFCAGIVTSLDPAGPLESQFAQSHRRRPPASESRALPSRTGARAAPPIRGRNSRSGGPKGVRCAAGSSEAHRPPDAAPDERGIRKLSRALGATENSGREARRAKAFEEARLLVRLDETEGAPVDPATDFRPPNGFVFSTAEIVESIRFKRRLGFG